MHSLRHDDIRGSKRRVNGGIIDRLKVSRHPGSSRHERDGQIVLEIGVHLCRLAGHGPLGVDHGWQRLVVDDYGVGRVTGEIAVAGHHHRNRLSDIPDDVGCNRPVIRRGERGPDRHRVDKLGDLDTGEHRLHPGHRLGLARINRQDTGVREVAPFERHVLHADDLDVVDIGAEALNETRVFTSFDALTDQLRKHGRCGHHLLLTRGARRVLHGVHNVLIPGAAAEIAVKSVPDLCFGRGRVVVQ